MGTTAYPEKKDEILYQAGRKLDELSKGGKPELVIFAKEFTQQHPQLQPQPTHKQVSALTTSGLFKNAPVSTFDFKKAVSFLKQLDSTQTTPEAGALADSVSQQHHLGLQKQSQSSASMWGPKDTNPSESTPPTSTPPTPGS